VVKVILNTVLGIILIFIWLKFVNIQDILSTIKEANVAFLIPAFIFMFLSSFLRSWRLKLFLSTQKKISLMDLTYLNGVAMMLNFFIPIRAGELAKGVYLNTNYKLDLSKSIIWVFLDRFVDFLVVLSLSVVLFFIVPSSLPVNFVIVLALIFVFGIITAYFIAYQQNLAKKLAIFFRHFLIFNIIKIYFDRFFNFCLQSFGILKRPPQVLLKLVLLTVLAYGADGAIWYFMFASLGQVQPYLKMYLGQMLSALTYLIPAAPGYVGSAEASGLLIFTGAFGMDANLASSMIVLFHICAAIFILFYGLISVYFLKIDLGFILKKAFKKVK